MNQNGTVLPVTVSQSTVSQWIYPRPHETLWDSVDTEESTKREWRTVGSGSWKREHNATHSPVTLVEKWEDGGFLEKEPLAQTLKSGSWQSDKGRKASRQGMYMWSHRGKKKKAGGRWDQNIRLGWALHTIILRSLDFILQVTEKHCFYFILLFFQQLFI